MSNTDQAKAPLLGRLEALTVVAVVGVLAFALALAALVMPSSTSATRSVRYTQSGAFHYSAPAKSSSVYGVDGLSTGEPIIARVVGNVQTNFDYRLKARSAVDAHGTASLDAVVSLPQGLSRHFVVADRAPFTGATTTVSGRLPLGAIKAYLRAAAKSLNDATTNVPALASATVTLRPHIAVTANVGGHALTSSYSPELAFAYDGSTLTLTADGQASVAAAPIGGSAAATSLRPSKAGTIDYRAAIANTVPLLVAHPSVRAARDIGFALAGLCLLLGLWLARPLLRSRDGAEPDRIRALYGSLLVPVQSVTLPTGPVADLASIDALAELAKRYESRILHLHPDADRAGTDCYLVWDNGMLYRYRGPACLPWSNDEPDDTELTTRLLLAAGADADVDSAGLDLITATVDRGRHTSPR